LYADVSELSVPSSKAMVEWCSTIALEDGTDREFRNVGINNTLKPGTYPKEKKLQSKHGESLKSRRVHSFSNLLSKKV